MAIPEQPANNLGQSDPYVDLVVKVQSRLRKECKSIDSDLLETTVTVDFARLAEDSPKTISEYLSGDVEGFRQEHIYPLFDVPEYDFYLDQAIEEKARELLGSAFAKDVAKVARHLNVTEEELCDRLVEDERLRAGELGVERKLDLNLTGMIDLSFNAGFKASPKPERSLFLMLERLAISPGQFLDAVRERCFCDKLRAVDGHLLGLETGDVDPTLPLFDLYEKAFEEANTLLQSEILRPHEFLAEPVVSPSELVDALVNKWPRDDDLFIHFTASAEQIYAFGDMAFRVFPEDERAWMHVNVRGVLSASEESSEEDGALTMKRSMPATLSNIYVSAVSHSAVPFSALSFGDVAQARVDAAELIAEARQKSNGRVISEVAWQPLVEKLCQQVVRATPFVRDRLMSYMSNHDDVVFQECARRLLPLLPRIFRQPDLPHVLGRELLAVLGHGNGSDDEQIERAEWLLREGADPEAASSAGVLPVHLAAQLGEAELLGKLLMFGADPSAVRRCPLTGCVQNPITIAISLMESGELTRQTTDEIAGMVLDAGGGLPKGPVAIREETYDHSLGVALLSRSERLLQTVLKTMDPARSSDDQAVIDDGFWTAALCHNHSQCAALLGAGADVNRLVQMDGMSMSLEDAIARQLDKHNLAHAKKYNLPPPRPAEQTESYQKIKHLIQAARARNAIASVVSAVRKRSVAAVAI